MRTPSIPRKKYGFVPTRPESLAKNAVRRACGPNPLQKIPRGAQRPLPMRANAHFAQHAAESLAKNTPRRTWAPCNARVPKPNTTPCMLCSAASSPPSPLGQSERKRRRGRASARPPAPFPPPERARPWTVTAEAPARTLHWARSARGLASDSAVAPWRAATRKIPKGAPRDVADNRRGAHGGRQPSSRPDHSP